jgi:hypothetical protein
LRKLVAEGAVGTHLNTVMRLVVSRGPLLVSVRKNHELDRYLLEKQEQEFSAKKRKRGSADDPICRQFGDYRNNGRRRCCHVRLKACERRARTFAPGCGQQLKRACA